MRILIASLPRAGSTMLFRAIAGLPQGSTMPRNPFCKFVHDLSKIPNKPFLKTHSPAPKSLPKDIRVIYLYDDPVKCVVSARKKRWDKLSWYLNNWVHDNEPDIYNKDDYGLEENFSSWISGHDYPVLAVRYESMWQRKKEIEKFVGFNFRLPEKKERTTEIDDDLKYHLQTVYFQLSNRMQEVPDVALISNEDVEDSRSQNIPSVRKLDVIAIQKKRFFIWVYEKLLRRVSSLVSKVIFTLRVKSRS